MKASTYIFLIIILYAFNIYPRVHIVLFDCSGSFIGEKVPEILKNGSLQKINELIKTLDYQDTLIFIPIRENSTVSSLNQIILTKAPRKKTYDKATDRENSNRIKTFVKAVLNEINKKPAKRTDIVSAINFAGSIAKLSNDASILLCSDGDDNVNAALFNNLRGVKVYHLFIYTPSSNKINKLIDKWKNLYSQLGVQSAVVLDAQSSINYRIMK